MIDSVLEQTREYGVERDFGFIAKFRVAATGSTHDSLLDAVEAARTVTIDYAAMNVGLRANLFLHGTTPFKEVRRSLPEPAIVPAMDISRDAAIDAYIDLFRQSVRRRMQEHSVVPLSGGCDSRHILLELRHQNHLPEYLVTLNNPEQPKEVEFATNLARRIPVKHVVRVPHLSKAIYYELFKNERGHFSDFCGTGFASLKTEEDVLPWWDGIAGDVLSAGLFLEDWNLKLFREGRLDELADRLVLSAPVPYFRDQSLFPHTDALIAVRAELEKHRTAANPIGSFYFWNRTRQNIAMMPFGMFQDGGGLVLTPYLDRDLWKLLASIPAELLVDHSFHRDTVARAYPEFADCPYYKKPKPPPRVALPGYRRKAWELIKFLLADSPAGEDWIAAARVLNSMFFPWELPNIKYQMPGFTYCSQIRRIAAGHPRFLKKVSTN